MTHRLITFLGKGRRDQENGYQQAVYRFPDGDRKTAYFGLALREFLHPDQLIVLGTRGSMWDVLLLSMAVDEGLSFTDAVDQEQVTAEQLAQIEPLVSAKLGLEVRLAIIPYGQNEAEQLEILQQMAEDSAPGDRVSLDITHGFRHLPLLSVVSALYLRHARQVEIAGIYYGALDMAPRDAPKPVVDLSGLLAIAEWVSALSTFDKDGDYGAFAPLLDQAGVSSSLVEQLSRAAFQERASNAHQAQQALRSAAPILQQGLPGIAGLFTKPLTERIDWHRRGDLAGWQARLARQYLQRQDYLRAAIYGYESVLSGLLDPRDDASDYEARRFAGDSFKQSGTQGAEDFKRLERLRNALAHGNLPLSDKVRSFLKDEQKLRSELKRLFAQLLPR